jgi:hypothetical protein
MTFHQKKKNCPQKCLPFHCNVPRCLYAGETKRNLNDHKRRKHGYVYYDCHLCGASVRHSEGFKEHLVRHKTDAYIRCAYSRCKNTGFSTTSGLKNHMRITHSVKAKEAAATELLSDPPELSFLKLQSLTNIFQLDNC